MAKAREESRPRQAQGRAGAPRFPASWRGAAPCGDSRQSIEASARYASAVKSVAASTLAWMNTGFTSSASIAAQARVRCGTSDGTAGSTPLRWRRLRRD